MLPVSFCIRFFVRMKRFSFIPGLFSDLIMKSYLFLSNAIYISNEKFMCIFILLIWSIIYFCLYFFSNHFYIFSTSLRYNWHTVLYNFKLYSINNLSYLYCRITIVCLVNIHHHVHKTKRKGKLFFFLWWILLGAILLVTLKYIVQQC